MINPDWSVERLRTELVEAVTVIAERNDALARAYATIEAQRAAIARLEADLAGYTAIGAAWEILAAWVSAEPGRSVSRDRFGVLRAQAGWGARWSGASSIDLVRALGLKVPT